VRMAIIGAAGVRTPLLIRGLSEVAGKTGVENLALFDIDSERLHLVSRVVRAMAQRCGLTARIQVCKTPESALGGAEIVITSIRVGGIAARVQDESIALAHGLVGQETVGAGGFACALRNLGAMLDYARLIGRVAPRATLVNFTNPVGIISQALLNHSEVRVLGVCDTPLEVFESIAHALGQNPFDLHFEYLGLNHLGWIKAVRDAEGHDWLPGLLESPDLIARVYRHALFPPEFIRQLGLLPTEYLYFYYFPKRAYENTQRSGQSRGHAIEELNVRLFKTLSQAPDAQLIEIYEDYLRARNASYFSIEATAGLQQEERELYSQFSGYERIAVLLLEAMRSDTPRTIPLTVRNNGSLADLEENDAVESLCDVSRHGVTPKKVGRAPEAVRSLLQRVKEYERLTVKASINHSSEAALAALVKNPLVGDPRIAKSLLADYLRAFGGQMGLAEAP
jgi:6-phospho-beta-glucosidase